jgi:hypothetical protein
LRDELDSEDILGENRKAYIELMSQQGLTLEEAQRVVKFNREKGHYLTRSMKYISAFG